MQETHVQSLGGEDPLEEETASHSIILAGKSHGRRSLNNDKKKPQGWIGVREGVPSQSTVTRAFPWSPVVPLL